MESAGVMLIQGDLREVAHAIGLSRTTMRNIRQNLFFAFIYNMCWASILYVAIPAQTQTLGRST